MDRKTYWESYYKKNRARLIEKSGKRNKSDRKRNREIVSQAKDRPCGDCGVKYPPWVMQFDHVRGEKKFILSKSGSRGFSVKTIEEEIAKCDVVCANCHADRTYRRQQHRGIRQDGSLPCKQ